MSEPDWAAVADRVLHAQLLPDARATGPEFDEQSMTSEERLLLARCAVEMVGSEKWLDPRPYDDARMHRKVPRGSIRHAAGPITGAVFVDECHGEI